MFKNLVLVLFSCIFYLPGICQDFEPGKESTVESVNGLLAFQVGVPSKKMQDAIRNEMGNLGFGGGLILLTNPFSWGKQKRDSPLRIGGELGYTYYGRFISNVNVGGYSGEYKTSYGLLNLNAIIQLRSGKAEVLNPFAEFLIGGNFYISSIRENLNAIETAFGVEASDAGGFSSSGLNKGFALGLTMGRPEKKSARFTLRLSYNWGDDIRYVVRNSLHYDPGTGSLTYQVGEAPVRYLMVQIGIGF